MKRQKDLIYNTEWDYLVILDACRYDTFKQVNWLEGDLEPVWTEGSATDAWHPKTFDRPINASLVTAHPFFSSLNPKKLDFSVYNFRHYVSEGISREVEGRRMNYCPPEHTTDRVLELANASDNDNFIVHYCQPHFPALGEPQLLKDEGDITKDLKNGAVSLDFVKKAYKGNLEYVLKEVERLANNLRGRIIVTSDHGELLGENKMFGHPHTVTCPELRVVPWFTVY